MAHPDEGERRADHRVYEAIDERLTAEFSAVHRAETVSRCVSAARYGALEMMGTAEPVLVERIARKHLEVLALVAAERRRRTDRTDRTERPGPASDTAAPARRPPSLGQGPSHSPLRNPP